MNDQQPTSSYKYAAPVAILFFGAAAWVTYLIFKPEKKTTKK